MPAAAPHPTLLTVLYDGRCSLCHHCKAWLAPRAKHVRMAFLAQDAPELAARFPGLRLARDAKDRPEELVVVADDGRVWRDDRAWLMVLWALREHRALAVRLAKNPATRALARRAFAFLSHNREIINPFLCDSRQDAFVKALLRPSGNAFEKAVMTCKLPDKAGGNGTLDALRQTQANRV